MCDPLGRLYQTPVARRPGPAAQGVALLVVLGLTGCAAGPVRPDRPAQSTLGCARSVMRDHVPPQASDKTLHCTSAGLIARYCSATEAYLTGMGKELKDLFGRGDAEWADWRADRAGVRCARDAGSDDAIVTCCQSHTAASARFISEEP